MEKDCFPRTLKFEMYRRLPSLTGVGFVKVGPQNVFFCYA
jgi:hypothetical protein